MYLFIGLFIGFVLAQFAASSTTSPVTKVALATLVLTGFALALAAPFSTVAAIALASALAGGVVREAMTPHKSVLSLA